MGDYAVERLWRDAKLPRDRRRQVAHHKSLSREVARDPSVLRS